MSHSHIPVSLAQPYLDGLVKHQLQYQHLADKSWLFNFSGSTTKSASNSESFSSRNFEIESFQIEPKIGYLFSKNASWDIFYEFQQKEILESLNKII